MVAPNHQDQRQRNTPGLVHDRANHCIRIHGTQKHKVWGGRGGAARTREGWRRPARSVFDDKVAPLRSGAVWIGDPPSVSFRNWRTSALNTLVTNGLLWVLRSSLHIAGLSNLEVLARETPPKKGSIKYKFFPAGALYPAGTVWCFDGSLPLRELSSNQVIGFFQQRSASRNTRLWKLCSLVWPKCKIPRGASATLPRHRG